MSIQLNLDLKARILDGKKTSSITIRCSPEYKSFFQNIVKLLKLDDSKLAHRYVLEGMQRELGNLFMMEPYSNAPLKEILSKFK